MNRADIDSRLTHIDAVDVNGPSVIGYFEESIRKNWDNPAFTDLQGDTLLYKEVAALIEKMHMLFKGIGIEPGQTVALCGKNNKDWGVAFLSVLSYGAIPVPILADFTTEYVVNIVNHSESVLLFAGEAKLQALDIEKMPLLKGIIQIEGLGTAVKRDPGMEDLAHISDTIFKEKYPQGMKAEDTVFYKEKSGDDMAILNYTSGTTSQPKGVMIPYRALRCNLAYAVRKMPMKPGSRTVSMLPLAHMFGLMYEFMYDLVLGCHIHFLTRMPSPQVIFKTFADFRPNLIITVPLVLEKVVKKAVLPVLDKPVMKVLMHIPGVKGIICNKIKSKLVTAFGGDLIEVIVGGAALNHEVEQCLRMIGFPYTVGYGSTECAPLISYDYSYEYREGSCGRPITGVQVKIDSADPQNIPGEILIHGDNVTTGYYRNPEATAQILDKDGWFHSGDIGTVDKDGYIFINGRCKSMILGPSGQNIYPEEIEAEVNNLPYITESLVVEREGRLVALVTLDNDALAQDGHKDDVDKVLDGNLELLNSRIPVYEKVSSFQIMEAFEKTPKGSIRRFIYQEK